MSCLLTFPKTFTFALFIWNCDRWILTGWTDLTGRTLDQKPPIFSRALPSCHCRWLWWRCTATEAWLISMTVREHNRGLLDHLGLLMEDSCQSGSIHVYVFLHRGVGVNSGHSDQLALAESGLLTLGPCWVALPINLLGLSWSWCSVLSSGSAKHTATFTPRLLLSVSLGVKPAPRGDLSSFGPHRLRSPIFTTLLQRSYVNVSLQKKVSG